MNWNDKGGLWPPDGQSWWTKSTPLYSVELEDCALPSFCDGTNLYYGTQEDILALLACDKRQPELLKTAQDYFSGKGDGVFKIIWVPIQFINPVECFGKCAIPFPQPFQHTHMNIWDYPYEMRAEKIEAEVYYLQNSRGTYLRGAKIRFLNLQYSSRLSEGFRDVPVERCWGCPGLIMEDEEGWITNRLLYFEWAFDSKEAMEQDMKKPNPEINFTGFFNEIFGDG